MYLNKSNFLYSKGIDMKGGLRIDSIDHNRYNYYAGCFSSEHQTSG